MATDLTRAFEALTGKLANYNTLFAYAEGNQPLVYSASRLQEAFRNIDARFNQNWCSVVINAALDRINLKGFTVKQASLTAELERIFNIEQVQIEAYDAHYAALVCHEAFVIVWKGEDDDLEVYYNDPRTCHMFYDAENPKRKSFAAKWFYGQDGAYHMTLYYPDRLEYYVTNPTRNMPASAKAFHVDPAFPNGARNPYGVIPVFHLRTNRRSNTSELTNILTLQDAINKLLADMLVAAEYGAFRQRFVISSGDISSLKNSPNEIWDVPAGDGTGQDTSVGQFDATDLDNYLKAINDLANSIGIISRTPKHYFFGSSQVPSGEALLAMEAPLAKKVQQREQNFGVTWQEIAAFLLLLDGRGQVPAEDITPVWEPAQSIQPYTEAQTTKTSTDAGIPLVTQLRREGWTESDLAQMEKDEQAQQEKSTSLAKALLDQARDRQSRQNPDDDNPGSMNQDGDGSTD